MLNIPYERRAGYYKALCSIGFVMSLLILPFPSVNGLDGYQLEVDQGSRP
jgi:hypothetical protein